MAFSKRVKNLISAVLALAVLLCSFPAYAQDNGDEPISENVNTSNVYFYNMGGGSAVSSDFILVQSGKHFGIIDSGHRYESTIEDVNGIEYPTPQNKGLSSQVQYKNGRDAMQYYIDTLGVKHLDFIIATHSHSDHIGGMPDIAQLTAKDDEGNDVYIVDSNTVYFYKQYQHVNNTNDDLAEDSDGSSWHNQAYNYQAVSAMEERGAITVELSQGISVSSEVQTTISYYDIVRRVNSSSTISGAKYINKDRKSYYDDCFMFNFGEYTIRLYNLFNHNTTIDENVNSIVTVISDGATKVACLADINVEDRAEQKLAKSISEDVGTIDILKVAHHGAGSGSSSKEMFDYLQPKYAVVTRRITSVDGVNPKGAFSAALYYARTYYNTLFLEAGVSDFALVAVLDNGTISFKNLTGYGDEAFFEEAYMCISNLIPEDGWSTWSVEWGANNIKDYYCFLDGLPYINWYCDGYYWYYFGSDGLLDTGWLKINGKNYYMSTETDKLPTGAMFTYWQYLDGKYYYFGSDRIMRTGWNKLAGNWYYFGADGSMRSGWQKIGSKWFYFNSDGEMATNWQKLSDKWYYFGSSGQMSTGWQKVSGKWYYFNSSGVMLSGWQKIGSKWYYFNSSGVMLTGWQKIGGSWYYFESNGTMRTASLKQGKKTYKFNSSGVCTNP